VKFKTLYILMLFISPCSQSFSSDDKHELIDLNQVIPKYRESLAALPVDYSLLEEKKTHRGYGTKI